LKPEHSFETEHINVRPATQPQRIATARRGLDLARVGDKWSVFVIMMLGGGPMRFNDSSA